MSKMSVRDIIDDSIPTMILGSIQRLIEGPERLQKENHFLLVQRGCDEINDGSASTGLCVQAVQRGQWYLIERTAIEVSEKLCYRNFMCRLRAKNNISSILNKLSNLYTLLCLIFGPSEKHRRTKVTVTSWNSKKSSCPHKRAKEQALSSLHALQSSNSKAQPLYSTFLSLSV